MISTLSNYWQLKTVLGCNILAFPTCCVLEPLKQLLIMLLLVNIILNSSLGKILHVYAVYIPLKLDNISCINVRDSMNIGILEEILLLTSYYSSDLTLVLFHLFKASLIYNIFSITFFSIFFFCFPFFSFLFLSSCCFSLHTCSYKVATTVCSHASYNKLMI